MPPMSDQVKPTGAWLYREFRLGASVALLAQDYEMSCLAVEDKIRAYLIARDKRRKRCPK